MKYLNIGHFLTYAPLYKKAEIEITKFVNPLSLNDTTFDYYCISEEATKTHMLAIYPSVSSLDYTGPTWRHDIGKILDDQKRYHFIHQYRGTCQSCKKTYIDFLLEVNTIDPINKLIKAAETDQTKLNITKVGSNPPYDISPNRESYKFFTEEDKSLYKKALVCLSQSYGIGAYAYFRRILENEIIRILEAISLLQGTSSDRVKELLIKYENDHQMGYLVDGVYQYLPNNLKSIGDNPLKLLYGLLSGGLHAESDDTCMTKAETINELLVFVITKIDEEKTSNSHLRTLIDKIRK